MYLVRSDLDVLSTLIKAQSSTSSFVYVDFEKLRAYGMNSCNHISQEEAISSNKYSSFRCKPNELIDSLSYLQEYELVSQKIHGSVYQVTRTGWRNKASRDHEIMNAILTHFAFPSLVALVTTLLTLFIAS